MTHRTREVLDAALRLPDAERLDLARQLLAALQGESVRAADKAWPAAAESRTRKLERGSVAPIPWSEVKRSARGSRRG